MKIKLPELTGNSPYFNLDNMNCFEIAIFHSIRVKSEIAARHFLLRLKLSQIYNRGDGLNPSLLYPTRAEDFENILADIGFYYLKEENEDRYWQFIKNGIHKNNIIFSPIDLKGFLISADYLKKSNQHVVMINGYCADNLYLVDCSDDLSKKKQYRQMKVEYGIFKDACKMYEKNFSKGYVAAVARRYPQKADEAKMISYIDDLLSEKNRVQQIKLYTDALFCEQYKEQSSNFIFLIIRLMKYEALLWDLLMVYFSDQMPVNETISKIILLIKKKNRAITNVILDYYKGKEHREEWNRIMNQQEELVEEVLCKIKNIYLH